MLRPSETSTATDTYPHSRRCARTDSEIQELGQVNWIPRAPIQRLRALSVTILLSFRKDGQRAACRGSRLLLLLLDLEVTRVAKSWSGTRVDRRLQLDRVSPPIYAEEVDPEHDFSVMRIPLPSDFREFRM